jgi:hypothetical protein
MGWVVALWIVCFANIKVKDQEKTCSVALKSVHADCLHPMPRRKEPLHSGARRGTNGSARVLMLRAIGRGERWALRKR